MECLSINSFLRNKHSFHLYVYDEVKNIPLGTIVKDANEIIPLADLNYKTFPKLALFADFFRYKLLLDKGGWWVDLDTVCIKPFDFPEDYVFSSEVLNTGGSHVNNGNIKAPKNSSLMQLCWDKCSKMDIPKMRWGSSGPALIRSSIHELGLQKYVKPPEVFCPIPPWDVPKLNDSYANLVVPKSAHAVHLWNNFWEYYHMDKNTFSEGGLYAKLKEGIVPHDTPKFPHIIIRTHMEMPFAAINGMYTGIIADNLQIIKKYPNIYVAGQSPLMASDLAELVGKDKVYYLPTRSKLSETPYVLKEDPIYDDVGCFGSLRVLKNHAVQAIAALKFARARGKKLRFHINQDFDEAYSPNVSSLLKAIFSATPDAELIFHQWNSNPEFQNLLSQMTIGLQVSMTESDNTIAKDMLNAGVPMVVSREIKWTAPESNAYPTNSDEIAEKMLYAMDHPELIEINRRNLDKLNNGCFNQWKKVFEGVRDPRVLFLVQKSLKFTGVKQACLEDNCMLAEHGIWSKVVDTNWSEVSIKQAIDEHKPTHIISEATWFILNTMFNEDNKKTTQVPTYTAPVSLAPSILNRQEDLLEKKIKALFQRFRYVVVTEPHSSHYKSLCNIYPNHLEELVDTPQGQKLIFIVNKEPNSDIIKDE